ncbi:MAG: sigma-70 family RNA polymerase sigma factor [Elusimicrobiota bacterium]|nr:sigma-70 family RNA polymerase sigma factor [Elusimicrobiota bacterium]
MIDPDIQTVDAVLAGDTDAFGQIVHRHQDRLYDLAYRLTGNGTEAEDIVQTAFIKIFSSLSDFNKTLSFPNWAYTITLNISRNRLRRKRIRTFLPFLSYADEIEPGAVGTTQEPEEHNSSPDDKISGDAIRKDLEEAISRLPQDMKAPFVLFHLHDQPAKDIASTMGLTPNAVSLRLFKARERLMLDLSPRYPEYFKRGLAPTV